MKSFVLAFAIASRAIVRNRLRATLTVLGILIGVASVVTITALGAGARDSVGGKIESIGSNAVLYCTPITGRTHQIRVHLSEMGHPILGDHAYGKREKALYPSSRCCLHALAVDFIHPLTGISVHVKADIPEDMQNIIQQLGIS